MVSTKNHPDPNNKRQRMDDEGDEDKLNSIIAKRDGPKVEVVLSHLVEDSGVKKYLVKWVGYSWVHELLDNDSRVLEGYICQQRSLRPQHKQTATDGRVLGNVSQVHPPRLDY
ncbi:hypothetical protein LTR56_026455 [Elasticomyces elasticus]|nr:hypothetical protein LTR56_026455 [Elasticomyces elasticus]